jgi:hypothetical protein
MRWWVYKCNNRDLPYQCAYGDWDDFDRQGGHWGNIELIPQLGELSVGDRIIAYQTDRNELVGTTEVRQAFDKKGYLWLGPLSRIGVKVRPLKKRDPRIAAIPAFKPGRVCTLYDITPEDAQRLLFAARRARARVPMRMRARR